MHNPPEQFLGWRQVRPLFGGISRTTAWRGVRDGWLPAPVQVSPGRRAWKASEVAAWQDRLNSGARPHGSDPLPARQRRARLRRAQANLCQDKPDKTGRTRQA